MNREGVARWPALLELRDPVPTSFSAADRGPPRHSPCLSAVCCSAATASPPVRADSPCYTWAAARRQVLREAMIVKGSSGRDS